LESRQRLCHAPALHHPQVNTVVMLRQSLSGFTDTGGLTALSWGGDGRKSLPLV
jgi:hypothetical protein